MRAVRVRRFLSCEFPGVLLIAALFGFSVGAGAAAPSGAWVRLGERQADFKVDRDRIAVGRVDGRFRQLQVTVKGAPLEMYDIVVTFGNDEQFKPGVRLNFDAKSMTRVIDLPGDARAIKHVDFYYRSVAPGAGRATITLFGASAGAGAAAPTGAWVRLGERQADFKVDRDRIAVGRADRFRQLQVTVKGAPLEMYDIVVTFGNDQQFKPEVRLSFDARSMTRVIDLPGEARAVKHVDFYYRSAAPGAGRATVTLYGR